MIPCSPPLGPWTVTFQQNTLTLNKSLLCKQRNQRPLGRGEKKENR